MSQQPIEPQPLPNDWTMVVAVAENGVIGKGDELPWKLSSDLQRFKKMTMGHGLLMGRKTYESIGRPLPGRQTIVLSRSGMPDAPPGVAVANNLDAAQELLEPNRKMMVVGGAQIYRLTMDRCRTIWLTRVQARIDGDVVFPTVPWDDWQLVSSESSPATPKDEWPTEFQVWNRKSPR